MPIDQMAAPERDRPSGIHDVEPATPAKRRAFSAATRRKMAAAQRKRWANRSKDKKPSVGENALPAPVGISRISPTRPARWAGYEAATRASPVLPCPRGFPQRRPT